MRKRPRTDPYLADREKGMTYQQIADKHGVSRQAIASALGIRGVGHFRPFTKENCVYPNLRQWLNENQVSQREFVRRLGWTAINSNSSLIGAWFRGKNYPIKENIDKILDITGLTYEELFEREI